MGSASRMARANRFIQEFGEDARRGWKIDSPCLIGRSLGQQEGTDLVYMFYTLRAEDGEEYELMLTAPMFFDPEMSSDEQIVLDVCNTFGMSKKEAVERLKTADLIHEDYA